MIKERGADVNVKNKMGYTPLHRAASKQDNNDMEMIKFLVESGAKVDAFHLTCEDGHLDGAQRLLTLGADVCKKTARGLTPLELAAEHNSSDVVRYLVRQCPFLVLEKPAEVQQQQQN